MTYFVTGATGFIGRNLVERLLEREGTIYVLVREGSKGRLAELRNRWGADEDRVVGVVGDLSQPGLGISEDVLDGLRGEIDHLFHLAAVYDMTADAESQRLANVEGTRHMVEFAEAVEAGRVHMVSSIAAAGLYKGTWREDMFDEAQNLDNHPYFRTKHDSEGIVRTECSRPWRVYRPGIVVGHSETGEMDKIDGPYYFFKLIRRIRNAVPQWMPMPGVEGREINLVPVDFVARAMDHIAHQDGLDGRAFHLTDPNPKSAGEVIDIFARAAHAPQSSARVPPAAVESLAPLLKGLRDGSAAGPGRRQRARRLRDPALRPHVRQLPDQLRQPAGAGGARGDRHPGASARGLRRQAVGLLGASPRSRPVPGPDIGGGSEGQGRAGWRGHPDRRAADPRRAVAACSAGDRHGLPGAGRAWAGGHGDGRIVRDRALGCPEDRRRGWDRPARSAYRREARGDPGPDRRRRRKSARPRVRSIGHGRRSTGWRTTCSPGTVTWTSSSTTRGARSVARSPSPTIGSTTSSARCSSTTSVR